MKKYLATILSTAILANSGFVFAKNDPQVSLNAGIDDFGNITVTGTVSNVSLDYVSVMIKKPSGENLDTKENDESGWVPDTTLFCLDKDRNIFVGAVNIRHVLNDALLKTGGHIGDGIRPSERRKGYATAMIALALDECKRLGIKKVLMTCDKNNIGSAKSIINNGGILENEIEADEHIEQRYWIQL